ncbi:unnamed protein product [Ectocarpus sp. 12 AP-2014]
MKNNVVPAPVRLAPIIRAPDRQAHNNSVQRRPSQKKENPVFTLYVNSSVCAHSADLMRDIRDVYHIPCTIIDVANGEGIPAWLKGTPSVVVGTDVYCGDTAFDFVASIAANPSECGRISATSPQGSSVEDIVSGKSAKAKNGAIGCGLAKAFSPPVCISEEEAEKKYSGSVDDAVARLMQSRG